MNDAPVSSAQDNPVATDRAALRRELRQRRKAMPASERAAASEQACTQLLHWLAHRSPLRIAGYLAQGSELDLTPALRALAARGHQIHLPAVVARSPCQMVFRSWDLTTDSLTADAWGLPAPRADLAPIAPWYLDVVLVPCLAVDDRGHRLGGGAGCYDRAFAFRLAGRPGPILMACGYTGQRITALTTSPWDVPMDAWLHDHGYRFFSRTATLNDGPPTIDD